MFAQDLFLSLLASLMSILLVRWLSEPIPGFTVYVFKWLAAAAAGMATGMLVSSSHKEVRSFATVRSMAKSFLTILIKEAVIVLVIAFGVIDITLTYAFVAIMADSILTAGFLTYLRLSARMLLRQTDIKAKASRQSALVFGTDQQSIIMADDLKREGYDVVGLVTLDSSLSGRVIHDYVIYLCRNKEDMVRLQWQLGGVDGLFFPKTTAEIQFQEGGSAKELPQQDGMSLMGHALKRSFDITLSGMLLLIFSPVIAICALMVHLEDGSPVIFAQERIGRGGKPFFIYKFRSMRLDAEQDGSPALYTGEDDPRLTRTGRFLRAHHLDELPQLWNVFKGDMSFIGYRPERQYYIDKIMECNARYRYLYQIRPGVTSYATLYNGYTDTLEKMLTRLDLDLYYLRNHSLWFDAKVLGLTFLSIVSGKKF